MMMSHYVELSDLTGTCLVSVAPGADELDTRDRRQEEEETVRREPEKRRDRKQGFGGGHMVLQ